jgi:hypothetical protein
VRAADGDDRAQSSDEDLLLGEDAPSPALDFLLDLDGDVEDDAPALASHATEDPTDQIVTKAGPGARDDALDPESAEIAKHLEYRSQLFGDAYPFDLVDSGVLELRELTDTRWLYLAMLVAANLRYVRTGAEKQELTTYFELLAPVALRGVFGATAEIHLFGTSTAAAPGRFSGSLREKVAKLAEDLRISVLVDDDDEIVNDTNYGDNGIDVVAYFPFADAVETVPTLLGQCACGIDPWKKMMEPTEENWNSILKFRAPVINMLLIPQCFRKPDGAWYERTRIKKGVLLDRVRLFPAIVEGADELPVAAASWPEVLMGIVGSDN